eukprot:Pompholyxophrys_punicea_v1_NODE_10_length_6905_cov_7.951686.p3 type:complete len:264 gc:universal NODE_10_length_6905_cov_7.951686:3470-2679(-)
MLEYDHCTALHEEADTRIVLHVDHFFSTVTSGSVKVRTVDTDVVVILVSHFYKYESALTKKIWVVLGTGKKVTTYSIHDLFQYLGPQKSLSLPMFHSFTDCDTVSAFNGKGKKTFWEIWKAFSDVTEAFLFVFANPMTPIHKDSRHFALLQRYVVLAYDKGSLSESVNETRQHLFCRENRDMERIPPTEEALYQHALRATYQASVWAKSSQSYQSLPSPEGWGWVLQDNRWQPFWSKNSEVSKSSPVLIKCGCKVPGCQKNLF